MKTYYTMVNVVLENRGNLKKHDIAPGYRSRIYKKPPATQARS
jgi:hypothetical protein